MVMRKGMTLIELLVVIGVMVVFVGLTFHALLIARRHAVALAAARDHAATLEKECRQRAPFGTCILNLRQLVQAVRMYEMDWGTVPIERYRRESSTLFQQMIYPYVRDKTIFLCPADPTRGLMHGTVPRPLAIYQGKELRTSYDYLVNDVIVRLFGKGRPHLKPRSAVIICGWHVETYKIHILGRHDGVVEIVPLGRYKAIRAHFEGEPGDEPTF